MIDLNDLLQVINVIVCVSNVYLYGKETGSNPYIDSTTVAWSVVIALQVSILLFVERRRRNPLIILLVINTLVAYLVRILTLQICPETGWFVMSRVSALGAQDINHALQFIFFGICAIAIGLNMPVWRKGRDETLTLKSGCEARKRDLGRLIRPNIVLTLFALSLLCSFYFIFMRDLGEINSYTDRLLSFLNICLYPDAVLLLVLAYWFTQRNWIPRKYTVSLVAMFVVYLVARIMSGSRSGVLMMCLSIVVVWLANGGFIRIRRTRALAMLVVVMPLVVITYNLGTSFRHVASARKMVNAMNTDIDMAAVEEDYLRRGYLSSDYEVVYHNLYERTGYLTDAADLIANHKRWGELINVNNVLMSVVNLLTPGFDVFQVGKISNMMQNVYWNQEHTKKYDALEYQSDVMTVYGEYYNLFHGYAGLIVMCCLAFLFNILYRHVRERGELEGLCAVHFGALTLYVFRMWLESFGTDWLIQDGVRMVVTSIAFIYAMIYLSRKKITARRNWGELSCGY